MNLPIHDAYVAGLEDPNEVQVARRRIRLVLFKPFVIVILLPTKNGQLAV